MRRLRVYLHEKYHVVYAYLFMGAFDYSRQSMYMRFQECGSEEGNRKGGFA